MADKPTNEIRDAIKKILGDHYSSYLGEAGLTNITEWHNGNTSPTKSEMCPFGAIYVSGWQQSQKDGRTIGGIGVAHVKRTVEFNVTVTLAGEDLEVLDEQMADYMDLLCVVLEYYWDFDVTNVLDSTVLTGILQGAGPAEKTGWHFQSSGIKLLVEYERTLGT